MGYFPQIVAILFYRDKLGGGNESTFRIIVADCGLRLPRLLFGG